MLKNTQGVEKATACYLTLMRRLSEIGFTVFFAYGVIPNTKVPGLIRCSSLSNTFYYCLFFNFVFL